MATIKKWVIDPGHSKLQFKVRHLAIANVAGSFRIFSGMLEAADDSFHQAKISFEMDANSIDTNNPDPARRGKPLLGAPILLSMKPSEANHWEGKVYNPKDGGFYRANISLIGQSQLKLEGCMLIFCSGETWTRAPEPPRVTTGAASTHPRSVCPQ